MNGESLLFSVNLPSPLGPRPPGFAILGSFGGNHRLENAKVLHERSVPSTSPDNSGQTVENRERYTPTGNSIHLVSRSLRSLDF